MQYKIEKMRRSFIAAMFFLFGAVALSNAQSVPAWEFHPFSVTVAAEECELIDLTQEKYVTNVLDPKVLTWLLEEVPPQIMEPDSALLEQGKLKICINNIECPKINIYVSDSENSTANTVILKLTIISTLKIRKEGKEWPSDYPEITPFPQVFFLRSPSPSGEIDKGILDLNQHVHDTNNPDKNKITWTVSYKSPYFDLRIDEGIATIEGKESGRGDATFRVSGPCEQWDSAPLTVIVNTPPKILKWPDIELWPGNEEDRRNLDDYVYDAKDRPDEIKWGIGDGELEYTGDCVEVKIDDNRIVTFSPKEDANCCGQEYVTFTVTDTDGATNTRDVKVLFRFPPKILSDKFSKFKIEGKSKDLTLDDKVIPKDVDWYSEDSKRVHVEIRNQVATFSINPKDCSATTILKDGVVSELKETVTLWVSNYCGISRKFPLDVFFDGKSPVILGKGSLTLTTCEDACDLALRICDDYDEAENITWSADSENIEVILLPENTGYNATFLRKNNWNGKETVTLTATDSDGLSTTFTVDVTFYERPTISEDKFPTSFIIEDNNTGELSLDDKVIPSHATWEARESRDINVEIITDEEAGETKAIFTKKDEKWFGEKCILFTATIGECASEFEFCVTFIRDGTPPVISDRLTSIIMEEDNTKMLNLANYVTDDKDAPEEITWRPINRDHIDVNIREKSIAVFSSKQKNWYGTAEVIFKATDSDGQSAKVITSVIVEPVNDTPVILQDNFPQQVVIGDTSTTLFLDDKVQDIDNPSEEITWIAIDGVYVHVKIKNNTAAIFTLEEEDWYGTDKVVLKATDKNGLSDTIYLSVAVTSFSKPPIILKEKFTPLTGKEDEPIELFLPDKVVDDDTNSAEVKWSCLPEPDDSSKHIRVTFKSGKVTFTPEKDWYGTEKVTIQATDSKGLTDSIHMTITFEPIPDAPVISTTGFPAPFIINEGESKTITLLDKVQDDDDKPEEIRWEPVDNPHIQVDIRDGIAVFSRKKSNENKCWYGTQEVFLIAIDSDKRRSMVAIFVLVVSVPKKPEINEEEFPDEIRLKYGAKIFTLSLDNKIIATGCGPQKITWEVDGSQHVTVNLENGLATITTQEDWFGTEQIEFKAVVKDYPNLYDTISIPVTVLSLPPQILVDEFEPPVEFLVNTSHILSLDGKVQDDNTLPGNIVWTIESNKIQTTISNDAILFLPTNAPSNETITLTATDDDGQSDQMLLSVHIIEPPVIYLPVWVLWQDELSLEARHMKAWVFQPKRHVITTLENNTLEFQVQPDNWYGVEKIDYVATYNNDSSVVAGTLIVIALPEQLEFFEGSGSSNCFPTSITHDGTPIELTWSSDGSTNIEVEIVEDAIKFTPRNENWAKPEIQDLREKVTFTVEDANGHFEACSIEVTFNPVIASEPPKITNKINPVFFHTGSQSEPLILEDDLAPDNNTKITWSVDIVPVADGNEYIEYDVDAMKKGIAIFRVKTDKAGWRGKEYVLITAENDAGSDSILLTVGVQGKSPRLDMPPFKLWQHGMGLWDLTAFILNDNQKEHIEWDFDQGEDIYPVVKEGNKITFDLSHLEWTSTEIIFYTATDTRDGKSTAGAIEVMVLPKFLQLPNPLKLYTKIKPEGEEKKIEWNYETECADVLQDNEKDDSFEVIFDLKDDTTTCDVKLIATHHHHKQTFTITVIPEGLVLAPRILGNRFAMEKGFSAVNGNPVVSLAENDIVRVNLADKIEPVHQDAASPSSLASRGITWIAQRSANVDVRIDNLNQTMTLVPDSPNGLKNISSAEKTEFLQLTAMNELGNYDTLSIAVTIQRANQTALLSNYPNPFNSETWIPYQLAENSDVVIRIYNHTGQLVRVIDLGHQRSGIYTTKEKNVYWDGRDNKGENVASGVYFYSLHAGQFTATRKMVIVK